VCRIGGLYSSAIEKIVYWLDKARDVAENETQSDIITTLIDYYRSGDLKLFDDYSIRWLNDTASQVDFINGFIETYGDPLGMKASWEALVNFKDAEATKRTDTISKQAQWFEDNSPTDKAFKKAEVRGVSAKVITAAILAGDLYPSTRHRHQPAECRMDTCRARLQVGDHR
jgi:dipeptidyl-peptidase-3